MYLRTALVIFVSFFATLAVAQKKPDQVERFENEAATLQKKLQIPGLSFAIVKDQKLLYATGLGWADIGHKTRATKNTLYSIASITKTFTSTLLMQLVEQGKLDLNDPISKYDSNFKGDSLKVLHFLTHTSEGKPGFQYRYSGDRFAVLQSVIEKITGKPYAVVIKENILDKAGMRSSVPGQDILETTEKYRSLQGLLAKPYTLYGTEEMILSPYPAKKITASAGLLSNVVDLAKYDIAIDKHTLLSPSTQQQAWTNFQLSSGKSSPYGYGWFVQEYHGKKVIWHYGQWATYTALYMKVPEENISLIMLANSDGLSKPFALGNGNLFNSSFALSFFRNFIAPSSGKITVDWNVDSARFQSQVLAFDQKDETRVVDEQNSFNLINKYLLGRVARVRKEIPADPRLLNEYAGTYELLPSPLKFSVVDKKFMLETSLLTSKVELYCESENRFFLKILNVQIEFIRNQAGLVDECILYLDGNKYRCTKLSNETNNKP
jgi:CubicO group peptidase (beta-lactamase class C family)